MPRDVTQPAPANDKRPPLLLGRDGWRLCRDLHRGLERPLAGGAVLAVLQSLVLLPIPKVLMELIDGGLKQGDMGVVLRLGGLLIGISLVGAAFGLWSRWILLGMTSRVTARLRNELVRRLHALPLGFHVRNERGRLHSVVVADTTRFDLGAGNFLSDFIPSATGVIGFTIVLAFLEPTLFLIALVGYVPVVIVSRMLARRFRSSHHRWREDYTTFSTGIDKTLRMMPLFRQAGIQNQDIEHRCAEIEIESRGRLWMRWLSAASRTVHNNAMRIGSLAVVTVGCVLIARGTVTGGELVAFYGGMVLLNTQAQGLLNTLPTLISMDDTLRPVLELMEQPADRPDDDGIDEPITGELAVTDVAFAYDPEEPVLRGITLRAGPGDFVALVGPSGGGKTTLLNLLLGILHPGDGTVAYGPHRIEEFSGAALRRQMGVLSHDVLLLNDTVEENIRLEKANATRAEVEAAARAAHLHDWIAGLPDGYETVVGEDGMRLSGGQRQRLALARALVREPRLLLLDEPTHGLDPATAREVLRTFLSLRGQCTIVLVTHDLDLVRQADIAYLLHDGRIVDSGRPEDLASSSASFRAFAGLDAEEEPVAGRRG